MAAYSQASELTKQEKEFPCAPPPSPITNSRRNFDLSVSPLSSSPEESFKDDDVDMSDCLIMALSRMNVEQSSLKRKKRSEQEFPSGYDGGDSLGQEQKKARRKKHSQTTGIQSHSSIQKIVSIEAGKDSL